MTRGQFIYFGVAVCVFALVLPVHAQYTFHFGRNKIQYENFDWHVLKTEHFDIYYYPEMRELAENGAAFAEEAYEELENKFNTSLNHRVPIIFYSSNLHFKQTNITPGFIPDGVGGFFEFLKGRVVIPANGNIHKFKRVIRHELVHVFTYSKIIRVMRDHRVPPDRFLPLWFTEGLADYWSGEPDYNHEMVMRDAIFSNTLVPLENMYRISGTFQMYKQGEALCRFMSEVYGEERILKLMENAWMDRDFNKILQITLQEPFLEIADKWQTWLKEQYYPELEDSDASTIVAGALAAKGFNSKPVFYRFKDGRRKVYFVGNHDGYANVFEVEVDSLYRPLGKEGILIRGERNDRFEAFHLFESRLSISPQGSLAFVTKSGGEDVIHVYDLERDELGRSYRFDGLIAVYSPTWSPEGTQLAFSSIDQGGFSDLYIYDTVEGQLQKITSDAYDDRDPSWSPDGRYIAFSSDRTSVGIENAFNLFTYDVTNGNIRYLTFGNHHDFSPRWSPSGHQLVFTSTRRDSTGRFSAQDIWVVDAPPPIDELPVVASAQPVVDEAVFPSLSTERKQWRLTSVLGAAFDPVWTEDDHLVFSSFENFRFTIRELAGVDSLLQNPKKKETVDLSDVGNEHWAFARIGVNDGGERVKYRRKYQLDIAQGAISNNPVWGTTGGAVLAFSDMMGNDQMFVTFFSTSQGTRRFLKDLNVAVTRVQLHRRANIGYGIYRYGGQRYDVSDPDASTTYPVFWETIYGGFGSVSYPISHFKRVELSTALSWSDKEIPFQNFQREALLLSNAVSITHDNTLFGQNGPAAGWRGKLTLGYTTDILYSNVSYLTFEADVRFYARLVRNLTYASRFVGRSNQGREARLFYMGGSWDLRGWRLFEVRGRNMWFTSHELRFPILIAPSLFTPVLAPFGIANLRGAVFFDAGHAWNDGYHQRIPQIWAGETLGATGVGFRMNLFGGFVLRYDIGYRFRNNFQERSNLFTQFFFGWDF